VPPVPDSDGRRRSVVNGEAHVPRGGRRGEGKQAAECGAEDARPLTGHGVASEA
jgi:hypothetical protein